MRPKRPHKPVIDLPQKPANSQELLNQFQAELEMLKKKYADQYHVDIVMRPVVDDMLVMPLKKLVYGLSVGGFPIQEPLFIVFDLNPIPQISTAEGDEKVQ